MTKSVSVLLPVYKGAEPSSFDRAIKSVSTQSKKPDELVIIKDGSLTSELDSILEKWQDKLGDNLTLASLSENLGVGEALRLGVRKCSHEFIARMDSDDIAIPERIKIQTEFLQEHPSYSVVGGYLGEYINDPKNIQKIRKVPSSHQEIRRCARLRCPMNHPTVMFRKSDILAVGNYSSLRNSQDYELWARLISQGYKLANLPQVLILSDMRGIYSRKGGVGALKSEIILQQKLYQTGFASIYNVLRNLLLRAPVRLAPAGIRKLIISNWLREDAFREESINIEFEE